MAESGMLGLADAFLSTDGVELEFASLRIAPSSPFPVTLPGPIGPALYLCAVLHRPCAVLHRPCGIPYPDRRQRRDTARAVLDSCTLAFDRSCYVCAFFTPIILFRRGRGRRTHALRSSEKIVGSFGALTKLSSP